MLATPLYLYHSSWGIDELIYMYMNKVCINVLVWIMVYCFIGIFIHYILQWALSESTGSKGIEKSTFIANRLLKKVQKNKSISPSTWYQVIILFPVEQYSYLPWELLLLHPPFSLLLRRRVLWRYYPFSSGFCRVPLLDWPAVRSPYPSLTRRYCNHFLQGSVLVWLGFG